MLLFLSTLALAQTPDTEADPAPPTRYAERTEIIFDPGLVEAGLVGPGNAMLLERKRASFNPMVQLRTDFADLMDQDVAQVR